MKKAGAVAGNPSMSRNAFEIFEIIPNYNIDLEALEDKYLQLSQMLHPDRFVNDSDSQRIMAANKSIEIAEAYESLKSPVSRACELLNLKGIQTPQETTEQDPEIILQTMQDHEALDKMTDMAEAKTLHNDLKNRRLHIESRFIEDLNSTDEASLLKSLNQLRYVIKTIDRTKKKLKELR